MNVNDTIREAITAMEVAKELDGKVIVCLCGTFAVEEDATACPSCGKALVTK